MHGWPSARNGCAARRFALRARTRGGHRIFSSGRCNCASGPIMHACSDAFLASQLVARVMPHSDFQILEYTGRASAGAVAAPFFHTHSGLALERAQYSILIQCACLLAVHASSVWPFALRAGMRGIRIDTSGSSALALAAAAKANAKPTPLRNGTHAAQRSSATGRSKSSRPMPSRQMSSERAGESRAKGQDGLGRGIIAAAARQEFIGGALAIRHVRDEAVRGSRGDSYKPFLSLRSARDKLWAANRSEQKKRTKKLSAR